MAMSRMTLKSVVNVPKAQPDSTQKSEPIALRSFFRVRGCLAGSLFRCRAFHRGLFKPSLSFFYKPAYP